MSVVPADDLGAPGAWIWNGAQLPKSVNVPCSGDDDGTRLYLSLLTFAKVWSDHASETNTILAPPVTSSLILASSFFFFQPDGIPLRRVALCPQRVVDKGNIGRMLLSPFIHIDKAHYLLALSMLFPASVKAEKEHGSGWFLLDLGAMFLLTQGIYVGWAAYEHKLHGEQQHFHSVGTVGLGPLAMAVKMAATHHAREGVWWVLGTIPVPPVLSCWAEMALGQLLLPEQNIRANLAGISAGLVRCLLLEPAIQLLVKRRKKRTINDETWLEEFQPKRNMQTRLKRALRWAFKAGLQLGLTVAGARACQEVEQRLVRRFRRRPLSQWAMK